MDNNPTRNNVAVKPEPLAETTQSGLFIGALPEPNHRDGEVVAVGPDCDTLKVGDRVMYMVRRAINSEGLHIVSEEDDVLHIYDKEET